MNLKMHVLLRFMTLLLLILFSDYISAQLGVQTRRPNVGINPNCNGYVEYLPFGYLDPGNTKKYPLLIFFKGNTSTGDGSYAALDALFGPSGFPPDQVQNGTWVDAFTVNGETHRFILISPQFVQPYEVRYPTVQEVNSVLNYMIAQYRVDTSRIYFTGNSAGGGPVWDYVALDTNSTTGYPNRIAAIVPFTGVSWPTQARATVIKNADVAVWAFHNQFDDGVPVYLTQNYINYINLPPAPSRPAKATIFPMPGHNSWYDAYNRMYSENGMNIYEWMLHFSRNEAVLVFCPGSNMGITSTKTGSNYQWQVNTGSGYMNISNGGNYSGTTTVTLQINSIPSNFSGYQYRCIVNGINPDNIVILSYRNQWTGAVNTSWAIPANWTCNQVPDINTDVIINSGTVIVSSNASCRRLTVKKGVNFTINPSVIFTVAR